MFSKGNPSIGQLGPQVSEKEAARVQLDDVMTRILEDHEGGEDTEALRVMRAQDPGPFARVNAYWGFTLLSFKARPFPFMPFVIYMVYTCAVIAVGKYIMQDDGSLEDLKTLKPELKDVIQVLGLAVFLVLTFRNNSAYQRWYDGATKWFELCGNVANAGRQVAAITPPDVGVDLLWWLVAALFAAKQQLRSSRKVAKYDLLQEVLPPHIWQELAKEHDKFNWAVYRYGQIAAKVDLPGKTEGKGCEMVMIAATAIMGSYSSCWRIVRTPFALSYLTHLRSFMVSSIHIRDLKTHI